MRSKKYAPVLLSLFILGLSIWIVVAAFAASPVHAAGPALQALDANNTPLAHNSLVVSRLLESQATSLTVDVRLKDTGGDITDGLLLLASDLKASCTLQVPCDSSPTPIDRSNIGIPQGITFKNGDIKDVVVTINNINLPAEYNGNLTFRLPGQAQTDALTIQLTLLLTARPNVVPASPTVTAKVAREQFIVQTPPINWLLPGFGNTKEIIELDNQTHVPVTISSVLVNLHGQTTFTSILVDLHGQTTCTPFTSVQLKVQLPKDCILLPNKPTQITLLFHPDALPADTYQGMVSFQLNNALVPVSVNVALNVRDGPILPFVLLLLGIVVGRFALSMTTPQSLKQVHLLPLYNRLKDDIQLLSTDEYAIKDSVKSNLNSQLQNIHGEIESSEARYTEDAVEKDLENLDDKRKSFLALQALLGEINNSSLPDKQALKVKVENASNAYLNNDDQTAQNLVKEIDAALRPERLQMMLALATNRNVVSAILGENPELSKVKQRAQDRQNPTKRNVTWVLAKLAGYEPPVAELRFWFLRPLLGLLILVFLVFLGFQILYLNIATFGAGGFYDYLGLVLWGFSTDTATRSLQNLPVKSSS